MMRAVRQGDHAAQRRELLRSLHDPSLTPFHLAMVYFAIGDKENGYAALDHAVELHEWWLITLPVEDAFDSVRQVPRFRAIEARVGLPITEPAASP